MSYTHYRNVISHLPQVDHFLKLPVLTSSLDERVLQLWKASQSSSI